MFLYDYFIAKFPIFFFFFVELILRESVLDVVNCPFNLKLLLVLNGFTCKLDVLLDVVEGVPSG